MDILDKSLEVIELYDIYQDLLTSKQKGYLEAYYFDNLSITEISENLFVSRNAVHDQLKKTVLKLYELEKKLNLKAANKKRKDIITELKKIVADKKILKLLEELEKVE